LYNVFACCRVRNQKEDRDKKRKFTHLHKDQEQACRRDLAVSCRRRWSRAVLSCVRVGHTAGSSSLWSDTAPDSSDKLQTRSNYHNTYYHLLRNACRPHQQRKCMHAHTRY